MLRFIAAHENVLVVVETMLLNVLNPMVMYLMIDVENHSIDEEAPTMMVKRFMLSLMFNWGVVLAGDVQDNAAVKDVVESQQRCIDVTDVEPDREADAVPCKAKTN